MAFLPIHLDVRGRRVAVIGGGKVAVRKVKDLLTCGACVTVIADSASRPLQRMASRSGAGSLTLRVRTYRSGDLKGCFLVIAATDDPAVQKEIRKEATRRKILLNVVDQPDQCDFIFPAKVVRGEFVVSVGTGGQSPALAAKVRRDLEKIFGPEYGELTQQLGDLRRRLPPGPDRDRFFVDLLERNF